MTRQRIRPSLKRSVYKECPGCGGSGLVKSAESMAIEVIRMLLTYGHQETVSKITLEVHERVANYLNNRKRRELSKIEEQSNILITIVSRTDVNPEHLDFRCFDATQNEVKIQPETSNSKR